MKFKPFKIGDIVEHVNYEGGFFEIVELLPTGFGNRLFFRLKLWSSPTCFTPKALTQWQKTKAAHEPGMEVEQRAIRLPLNAMEVLAIAWAKETAQ